MSHKILIKVGVYIFLIFLLNSCERTFEVFSSNKIIFSRGQVNRWPYEEIWIMDSDGRNPVMLKKEEGFDLFNPKWSPDGKKIVYSQYKYKNSKICIITYHEKKQIIFPKKKQIIFPNDSLQYRRASWSPDGKWLAFSGAESTEDDGDIYIMEINGKNKIKIASTPNNDLSPIWSPDGKNIAFISGPNYGSKILDVEYVKTKGNSDIYIVNIDSKKQIRLTDNPTNDLGISWSPDGRKIVYTSWQDNNYEIFVIDDIDTKSKRRLTNNSVDEWSPIWAPDGKAIAFVSENVLCLMDSEGKNKVKLTDKTQCYIYGIGIPNWSSDGKKIVFDANDDIYIIDRDGKNLKNLTNTKDCWESFPSWRPIPK